MSKQAIYLAEIVQSLQSNWTPHPSQKEVIQAFFGHCVNRFFLENGRKFGKTELVCYVLWRYALTVSNAEIYYVAPFLTQARELLWANQRIQRFGPSKYMSHPPNNSDMRLRFTNGSFIKLTGADNFDALRGVKPDLTVLDEYASFNTAFWPAYEPNMAAKKNSKLGVIGTPPEVSADPLNPDRKHPFFELADEIHADPNGYYQNRNSFNNPHVDHDFLNNRKKKLIDRGDESLWLREYEAKRVTGGAGSILPTFDKKKHILKHVDIMSLINRQIRYLDFYIHSDPGTASVFAMLFAAVNRYTKTVYFLDELYEDKQIETSTAKIIPRKNAIVKDLAEFGDWYQGYDEAATWFNNESIQSFKDPWIATSKASNPKTEGLSLIKDQLTSGRMYFSDRCIKTTWEIENYIRDKNGKIPKVNDHQIDNMRYINAAAFLSLDENEVPGLDAKRNTLQDEISKIQYDQFDSNLQDFM